MVVTTKNIKYPIRAIRRLVVIGKDMPKNMAILLGGNCTSLVEHLHKTMRMEVLLKPSPGSPVYSVVKMNDCDRNCPIWSPREASAQEKEQLGKIREAQENIKIKFNPINIHNFLEAHSADDWSYYQDAISSSLDGPRNSGYRVSLG